MSAPLIDPDCPGCRFRDGRIVDLMQQHVGCHAERDELQEELSRTQAALAAALDGCERGDAAVRQVEALTAERDRLREALQEQEGLIAALHSAVAHAEGVRSRLTEAAREVLMLAYTYVPLSHGAEINRLAALVTPAAPAAGKE